MPRRLPPRQTTPPFAVVPDLRRALGSDWRFLAATALLALLAHAGAYLVHEYCHTLTAWMLGFKRDPLALDYGPLSLANLLFQQDVDDAVDYAPIFASHHDLSAALIALAGPGLGNGVAYLLLLPAFRAACARDRPRAAATLFWLALFSAGKVWSYAPTRTVTTHGDMALLARGLHLSPWALLPLVTVPALLVLRSVFRDLFPAARAAFLDPSPVRLAFVSALSGWVLFGFFGGLDLSGRYGPMPAALSVLSVLVLLPLSVAWFLLAAPPPPPSLPASARPILPP